MTESAPQCLHPPPLRHLNTSPSGPAISSSHSLHPLSLVAAAQSPAPSQHASVRPPPSAALDSRSHSPSPSDTSKSVASATTTPHAQFVPTPVYSSSIQPSLPAQHSTQPRLRQLLLPMLRTTTTTTTTTLRSSSPGSPPDLTDSKSSKSSSFPSSSLPDAAPADLSHFEDISLDDVAAISSPWHEKAMGGSSSGQIRPHGPPASLYRASTANSGSLRDLTNASRPLHGAGRPQSAGTAASAAGAAARNRFQLPVPGPRSARPRVKQLMTNGHSILADKQPRSPSATAAMQRPRNFSPSPLSAGASSSSGRTRFSSASIHVRRRQSWQPGRKTVKELEDEYTDSDEELPEDAVIWNVPISPRPPHERELRRIETDPSSLSTSLSPSIHRLPGQTNSSAIGPTLDRADTNLSMASAPAALTIDIKRPLTPHSPGLSDTNSADYPGSIHSMSKRDAALSALSKDARELTEALELYAEERERKQEERVQSGKSKSLSMPTSPTRPSLPPVRRNDPLIDPLPVSKEKERFLTRTRPSWLPPKSKKEERRHLKEYQKMMAHAAEAEKKRSRQQQKVQCELDDAALERTKLWDTHVLPNWRTAIREPKTKELWWSGIPPQRRGDVWSRAIGNELGLNSVSYEAALKRAQETDARLQSMTEEDRERDTLGTIFAKIQIAASSIYPELSIFQPNGPLHQPLLDVCKAYTVYRITDSTNVSISAFSSIPSLAALFLLNMSTPSTAFIALANALNRPLPSALLAPQSDPIALHTSYNLILASLQSHLPALHAHLLALSHRSSADSKTSASSSTSSIDSTSASASSQQQSSPSQTVIADLLHPVLLALVFATPRLGVDVACRVWDVVAFEGDGAMARAAGAVLERLEGRLYGGRWAEVCRELAASPSFSATDELDGEDDLVGRCGGSSRGPWPLGTAEEFVGRMRCYCGGSTL